MPEGLTVVQHPVLDDRLAVLRDASTPHGAFRQALSEASAILAVESTRDLPTVAHTIDTPLETAPGRRLEAEITIVPVLRAGLGMVDGFLRLLARARVGHLGVQRDEDTLEPTGDHAGRGPAGADRLLRAPAARHGGGLRLPAGPDAGHRRQRGRRARAPEGQRRAPAAPDLPGGGARGRRGGAPGASRRADLDGGARPPARRERLHPSRARGCRRPRLRHDGLRPRWRRAASRSRSTSRTSAWTARPRRRSTR